MGSFVYEKFELDSSTIMEFAVVWAKLISTTLVCPATVLALVELQVADRWTDGAGPSCGVNLGVCTHTASR